MSAVVWAQVSHKQEATANVKMNDKKKLLRKSIWVFNAFHIKYVIYCPEYTPFTNLLYTVQDVIYFVVSERPRFMFNNKILV